MAFSVAAGIWFAPFGSKVDRPALHVLQASLAALALSSDRSRVAAATRTGSLDISDTAVPCRIFGLPLNVATTYIGLVTRLACAYMLDSVM